MTFAKPRFSLGAAIESRFCGALHDQESNQTADFGFIIPFTTAVDDRQRVFEQCQPFVSAAHQGEAFGPHRKIERRCHYRTGAGPQVVRLPHLFDPGGAVAQFGHNTAMHTTATSEPYNEAAVFADLDRTFGALQRRLVLAPEVLNRRAVTTAPVPAHRSYACRIS